MFFRIGSQLGFVARSLAPSSAVRAGQLSPQLIVKFDSNAKGFDSNAKEFDSNSIWFDSNPKEFDSNFESNPVEAEIGEMGDGHNLI